MRISNACGGFTLTELAVAMVLLALMVGGLLVPMAAQRSQHQHEETRKVIAEALDALKGFAAVNGRVPCPSSSQYDSEWLATGSPATGGKCHNQSGLLSALTLGIQTTDAWARPLRYAVATRAWDSVDPKPTPNLYNDPVTIAKAIWSVRIAGDDGEHLTTDLGVCSDGTRNRSVVFGDPLLCPPGWTLIADGLAAVVWSDGPDDAVASDDLVEWNSWYVIQAMMVRSGIM